LKPDEMSAATTGKPVVRVLDSSDPREIAVFGIVLVNVPRSFYAQRAADFRSSLRNPARLRFGLFSDPATPADVAALTLPHDDVKDLARCRPGSCNLKLSADAMARLQGTIDPASPVADSIAAAFFREHMIAYVTGYRARGDSALLVYSDQPSTTAVAQVFGAILSRSPYVYQYAPTLEQYLKSYPRDRPADLSEALFWAEDDLPSLKATITVAHIVVYAPPELPGTTLIVAKQLYADHYLDGALELTALVDQAPGSPGIYNVLLRRVHFDNLPSGGPINVRGKVIGKLRGRAATDLRDAKTQSEQAFASAPASAR
jgi:hypothetical protein